MHFHFIAIPHFSPYKNRAKLQSICNKRVKAMRGDYDYELIDDSEVILYHDSQEVKVLRGKQAAQFLQQIEGLDERRIEELIGKLIGGSGKRHDNTRRHREYERF